MLHAYESFQSGALLFTINTAYVVNTRLLQLAVSLCHLRIAYDFLHWASLSESHTDELYTDLFYIIPPPPQCKLQCVPIRLCAH